MITISLCMIVKDEEDVLARCLDSVSRVADEIIIVDTGSTDKTKEIAGQYTEKVYDFPWIEDFAAARNFSFSKAEMEYCMWLDADDILLEEDQNKLLQLKETLPADIDIVMMQYHTAFDEQGNPSFFYYRERIVRNHRGFFWKGAIHEVIMHTGKTLYSDAAVTHRKLHPSDPDRNLRIFELQIAQGAQLSPRDLFYYGRELYYHKKYQQAAAAFTDLIAEKNAWIENLIESCRYLAYCYYALGEEDSALKSLLQSLAFDLPRAETCCDIARHFFDRDRIEQAIFWYKTALTCKRNDQSCGFISSDCYGYLPCIQLCVCYDKLGRRDLAVEYNEKAGQYKPYSKAYLYNKTYFEQNPL